MTQLYLIRHGDYIDLEDGKYLDDPGLSPEGVRQTELLRDRLLNAANTPGVSIENTSLTQWVKPENAQKWVLKRFNDYQHLSL